MSALVRGSEGCDGPTAVCESLALDSVRVRLVEGPPRCQACTMQFGSAHRGEGRRHLDGVAVDTTFCPHRWLRNLGLGDGLMSGILPAVSDG